MRKLSLGGVRGIKICIFTFTATAVDKLKITNGRVALASYCFYRLLGVNIVLYLHARILSLFFNNNNNSDNNKNNT